MLNFIIIFADCIKRFGNKKLFTNIDKQNKKNTNMKKNLILVILFIGLFSCLSNKDSDNKNSIDPKIKTVKFIPQSKIIEVDKEIKYKMFCESYKVMSTAPNYVVVIVKNLKTGETKEICTEAPSLPFAVSRQKGTSYAEFYHNYKKYKDRYFEFSNDSALNDINFNLYSKLELEVYSKTINVMDTVNRIKSGKMTSKTFFNERKEQIMFAHLMFNCGVMASRGCIAGNECFLEYFKSIK